MIGKLSGLIDEIYEDRLILDVNGVGYVIYSSSRLLANLPPKGAPLTLYIETQWRQENLRLYGFNSRQEQDWFTLLQNVQGLGSRLALALLGTFSIPQLSQIIAARDITALTKAPGVGKKMAERIVTELKSKISTMDIAQEGSPPQDSPLFLPSAALEALSGLEKLGYSHAVASDTITRVIEKAGAMADTGMILRLSLQELGSK